MSICFHSSGVLLLKDKTNKDFSNGLSSILMKYDDRSGFMHNDNGLVQFFNYGRHYCMSDVIEYINNNVDMVDSAQIWFDCDDEDDLSGNGEGFPFEIFVEVCNGKVYEETLKRRLPCDWFHYTSDTKWFDSERKKKHEEMNKLIEERKKEIEKRKLSENDGNEKYNDDLPF